MPLPDASNASLALVAREVSAELNEARTALEAFAERPEDRAALQRFASHVHLARGALRLAEVYGGALLGEEMEQVARYVDGHYGPGEPDADGLDALMRAMEQLPAYVERVASGGRDVPIALLPLLNDLRAVRGSALLSEGTILLLNLRSDESPRPLTGPGTAAGLDELSRRLRPRFQLALLGWIRGEHVEQNLAALGDVAAQFEVQATTQPLFQLWWVVAAVIEALCDDGVDANVSVKRLLGQVDREMRRLQERGEAECAAAPPVELLNNLLFYVARSRSAGPRVVAVRESFHLEEVLAASGQTDEASETLSAPSVRLMKTVAAAIREDLTRVKDVLDIFVRRGATQVDDLVPQVEMLRKISDTLGVLGLGALRDGVQAEIESLQGIVERRIPPKEQALLGIASALIEVEDSLDSQLVKLILPEATPSADAAGEVPDAEFRHVQDAVLRECIVNMARVKEAITQSLGAPDEAQGLDQVPQLVRGITAGLLMLGRQRAVEVMERLGRALGGIVRPEPGTLAGPRLERLADAIVAVEYYMEMLQAGRPDPWPMLENAEQCLASLEPADFKVVALRTPRAAPMQPESSVVRGDAEALVAGPPAVEAPVQPVAQETPAPTQVDAEFVQIFVEEARENIARLQAILPRWAGDPLDVEALRDVRRVFHTLKGSGRMVGALHIGEFSWSVESLLNRVISQTLPRSADIVELVREAVALLPGLVDELERGVPPGVDVAALIVRADALSGRDAHAAPAAPASQPTATADPSPAAALPAETAPAAEVPAAPDVELPAARQEEGESEPAGMDPVLREIFRKETAGHVTVVRDFLQRCETGVAPHAVSEALYRACHTLSGIAKTAGARQGIKVAEPMEHYLRKLYESGHGLPADGIALLRDTVLGLENVVEHVEADTGYFPDHVRLVAGWHALDRALDAELASLTEAAERTVAPVWEVALELRDVAAAEVQADVDGERQPAEGSEAVSSEGSLETPAEERPAPDPEWPSDLADDYTERALPILEDAEGREDTDDRDDTLLHIVLPSELDAAPGDDGLADSAQSGMDADFDPDIAAIFGEEAGELLEQADAALANWARDRADRGQVTELKRLLHTLKGGARMAGIRTMGDLSHGMESFLDAVETGSVAAGGDAVAALQSSLDELHRMRDAVNAGQPIASARELIGRLHAVARTSSAAAVTDEPSTASEPGPTAKDAPADARVSSPEVVVGPDARLPGVEADLPIVAEHREESGWVAQEQPQLPPESPPPADDLVVEQSVPGAPSIEPAAVESAGPVSEAGVAQPAPVVAPTATHPLAAAPALPGREPAAPAERQELARVDAELLDDLLNYSGEVSIFRARIEQQMTSIEFNIAELGRTVTRLREQLRKLEIETEAQILFEHQEDAGRRADFDPLELDRYSMIQQLSRALAESVSDVASLEGLLGSLNREGQNLLQQQGRVVAELQNGLMRTRMVPFHRHAQRLTRLVRQAAQESGKKVELVVEGGAGEIDRQVLERMLPPFEHMLRNSVVHGIEAPEQRAAAGKPATGKVTVSLQREGAEVVIVVEDDGAGLNIEAIRGKARQMGLLRPGQDLTDEESLQLIMEPGFSTADRLTQQAGRGVGMDVVATEVKKLGGGLFVESTPGRGARFTIRLPFTLAITQSLIVRVHDEFYALPVATVEGVARLPGGEIARHLAEDQPTFDYGGQTYRFQHLGLFVGSGPSVLPETDAALPVILVRAGEHSTALVTDELVGSREIVVKSVGPQVSSIRGISGATILGDGRIVVILDMGALVRSEWRGQTAEASARPTRDERIFALVVDDSITVRRVTQRLLERNGMRVLTAKDGVDAMALLQEHVPDVILLDIEMPRMDGYEVATHVRSDPRLADVPIIMITSRVGDKHRARAIEIGVDDYLGKPYQESELLDAIEPLVFARRQQPL